MACPDIDHLLDAFVDSELPPPQLLQVAQHAAACADCEVAIGELTALRQSVAALVEQESARLDVSRVWPAVEAAIAVPVARAVPGRVVALRRAVPALPAWGVLAALAASVVFWLSGPPAPVTGPVVPRAPVPAEQVASVSRSRAMRSMNHADIDRLAGKDIAVRREPKSGTTIIWVSHEEGH